jgi:hypothetical protein
MSGLGPKTNRRPPPIAVVKTVGDDPAMNSKILCSLFALLTALPTASSPASASAKVLGDCSQGREVSVDEANETLSRRSVEIIGLAAQGEVTKLVPLLAPTARFTVWEGDAGSGRRSGPAGAVAFARTIGATGFRYLTTFAGPISTDICGTQTVTIWLTRPAGQRSYVAVFKYDKGILIEASATMGQLSEGNLPD